MSQSTNPMGDSEIDEVSVSDMVRILWGSRGVIVFMPLFMMLAVAIPSMISAYKHETAISLEYSISLDSLTDFGTRYPNGTFFSAYDLVNPEVLGELAARFGTEEVSLHEALSISLSTPFSARAVALLENIAREDDASSLSDVTSDFESAVAAIRNATIKTVRISLDSGRIGLTEKEGSELLSALPDVWDKQFNTDFLFSSSKIELENLPLEMPSAFDSFRNIEQLGYQLEMLSKQLDDSPVDKNYRGSAGNRSAVDTERLRARIETFRNFEFKPLLVHFYKISGDRDRYLKGLELEERRFSEDIEEIDGSLKILNDYNYRQQKQVGLNQEHIAQINTQTVPILLLRDKAQITTYLLNSLNQRADLVLQRSKVRQQYRLLMNSDYWPPIPKDQIENAKDQLRSIIEDASRVLKKSTRAKLYTPMSPIVKTTSAKTWSKADSLRVAIAGILGFLISAIYPFIRRGLRLS